MRVNRSLRERLRAALDGFHGRTIVDAGAAWRLLAQNAPDLITRHAPDGRIRFASNAAAHLLGRDPAALEGMAPADLAHPEDVAALQATFRDASYFGRDGTVAARLGHGDGRWLWMELRCRRTPLTEEGGGDIVAVTREIGAFKAESAALAQARDDALAATKEKTRFLANMSHELRTPLNAIIGFSEVMAREMFGTIGSRYQEYAGLIQDSGQHLLDLINGLLDMSKIEAGKFELYEELFAVDEVVASAARTVGLGAERMGVSLAAEVAPAARLAFADKRAVKQMLVNLLSNAVKFTPPGGAVTLCVPAAGKAVIVTVTDTGTGIAPADLARLGKPFEQAQGALGKEGTGLGLALVKSLAALHGGEAEIQSVLGEGTQVTLRLPHAAVEVAASRHIGHDEGFGGNLSTHEVKHQLRQVSVGHPAASHFSPNLRYRQCPLWVKSGHSQFAGARWAALAAALSPGPRGHDKVGAMESTPRLKAGLFVRALIRRAEVEGASAFIVRKDQEEAGAIILKLARLDGTVQVLNQARMGDGGLVWARPLGDAVPDARAAAWCDGQVKFDPDLWIVEIEDRQGRAFVDEPIV